MHVSMLIPIFSLPPHVNVSISHTYHLESFQPVHLSPHPVIGAPAPATMAAAPSERHRIAATAPLFPAPPLLLFSLRCHGSPLHRAAGGDFAGGETDGEEMGCFAHDGFGLGF